MQEVEIERQHQLQFLISQVRHKSCCCTVEVDVLLYMITLLFSLYLAWYTTTTTIFLDNHFCGLMYASLHLMQLKDRYELLLKEVTHSAAAGTSGQATEQEV